MIYNQQQVGMSQLCGSKPQKTVANFIKKLVDILQNPAHSGSVIWKAQGDGFIILDQSKFTSKVLPFYYRHRNMSSFVRQLNMYGFHKIKENELSFYYHPYFRKDNTQDLHMISRKPEKKIFFEDEKKSLKNQQKDDKQNLNDQLPFIERAKTKKVSFFDGFLTQKHNKHEKEEQLMSNFTIKFKQPKSNIFHYEEGESPIRSYHYCQNDEQKLNPSIGNIIEEKEKGKEMMRSSHQIIYWKPESMMSELDLQAPSEKQLQ